MSTKMIFFRFARSAETFRNEFECPRPAKRIVARYNGRANFSSEG